MVSKSEGGSGQVAVIGGAHQAAHGGRIERAGIILDQAAYAERLLCGPVDPVFRQAKPGKRRRDAERGEEAADLANRGIRNRFFVLHSGGIETESPTDNGDFRCGDLAIISHHIRQHGRNPEAVRRMGQGADRILHGMGRSSTRRSEGAAGCERTHHHISARIDVGAVDEGLVQAPAEEPDGMKRELVGEIALTDEDMLLRELRIAGAAHGREGFDGMR